MYKRTAGKILSEFFPKALAKKLHEHPVFKNYEIVLAAGDGKLDEDQEADDKDIKKAYDKVTNAISKFDKTITLSVGQLTTGVTIPEWSAVLMLSSLKSPALYMQAAFRAQNPCLFSNGKEQYRKKNAYIFDFDPARTLIIYEQIANGLSEDTSGDKGDSDTRKQHVRELLNFFPVVGEDENGEMIQLDAEKVLSIPRKLKSQEVVRRGFMSDFLFQNIGHIFNAPQAVIDILTSMEAVKEPTTPLGVNPDTAEELSVDESGEVKMDTDYVIGKASELFGAKIFDTDSINDQVAEAVGKYDEKKTDKKPEDTLIETLSKTFKTEVTDHVIQKATEEYGKDISASTKKTLERKLQTETHAVVGKAVGDFKIQQNILIPSAYYESIGRTHARKVPSDYCKWDQKTIVSILENRQYTGCAVNFKSTTVSYKVHKVIHNPTEEYQIIPNMQEPIISEEQWLRVQELRKHRRRPTATGRQSLFSGLVYCPDCGAKLHFCAAKSLKRNQEFWRCSNYKSGRGECQIHYIRDTVLEQIVLESIRSLADFVKCYESAFLYMLAKKTSLVRQTENKKLRLSVERGEKRIAEIDRLIEKVFEQNAAGILSNERFSKLLQNYEREQKQLQTEMEKGKASLNDANQKVTDLRLLLRTLREITEIKELTPTLVNTLIERIEVHNNDKSSGHCYVKVDVYFTAVGMVDIPTEQELLAILDEVKRNPQEFRFIA